PGSTFDVTRDAGKVVVKMTRGKLDLAVAHREGRLFVVRAGDTDVEDVGTKFSVAWGGAAAGDGRGREGAVKVKNAHQEGLVAKDQEWRPDSGVVAIVEVAQAAPPDDHHDAAPVVAVAEPVLHDRHAAVPEPRPRAARAEREPPPVLGEPIAPAKRAIAIAPNDPYVDLKLAIRQQPLAFDPRVDGAGD